MTTTRSRQMRTLAIALLALLSLPAMSTTPAVSQSTAGQDELAPNARHEGIGEMVATFIQKSHYNEVSIDDALSSKVLDFYIESLDRNRMYLLSSDIENFERYRYQLDDVVKSRPLDPVFDIYQIYQTRVRERLQYAVTLLEQEPDYFSNGEFSLDRSEAPWAADSDELDEIWSRRITNDALELAIEDEPWEKIQEVLTKRYNGYLRRLGQINSDDVFERFMNTFAHAVDPHSSYMSPRNADEYRIAMSLSYVGIGASLQTEDDYVQIVNIIPGGPADADGTLKSNDRITGVAQGPEADFTDVLGWRLDDVVDLIRGPEGTIVRLQIIPANAIPGSPRQVLSLTRGPVKLEEQAAKAEVIQVPREGRTWSIGIIEIPSFYRDYRALTNGDMNYTSVTKDVKRLIADLEDQGIDGLVIDLRNNGGGHLTEATALSGLFIDSGPIVQLRNDIDVKRSPPQRLDDPDPRSHVAYNGPLAVLVNRYSASASEIFAGAIQDYARGVVIGQQTFGKGTVQNLFPLDQYFPYREGEKGLGQLTLTIGKYYRVTGESTQHRGVLPDIALPSAIDVDIIGESARKNALPWDTVRTTAFRAGEPLGGTIETLTANHVERSKQDPNYQFQLKQIQVLEEAWDRTTVSLNLERRRAEEEQKLADALQAENARRTALGLSPIESLEAIDDEERPDVQLEQAAKIVTDLATLREVDALPSHTAQIGS